MRLNWFTLKLGRRVMWCLCEALGVTWWVSDWADGWDCVRERDLWRDSCLESGPGCQIRFGLLIDLQRSFTLHSEPHSLRTHLWLSDCQPPTDCLMPVIFYSGLRQWEYYPGPLFGYLHLTVPAPTPWVTLFNVTAVLRSRVNSLSPLTQPRWDATSKLERLAASRTYGKGDRQP